MRSKIQHYLMIAALMALPFMASAQEKLTFKEAVKIGLQNNVTLNQQRNNLFQSQVQKTSRILQLGPQVSVNGNVGIIKGNYLIPSTGVVTDATTDLASASLDVNLPIFTSESYDSGYY